jgi:hypothetical protein
MALLTRPQRDRLERLPDDHAIVSAAPGAAVVERGDGRLFRVEPDGRLVATDALVARVQSYLHVPRC